MKRLLLTTLVTLLALAPAAAQARPGALDPSFGRHGRIIASSDLGGAPWRFVRTRVAGLPDGRFVVLAGNRLNGFYADGAIGQAFGPGEGPIPVKSGDEFHAVGIAADAAGRVVVAGTVAPAGSRPTGGDDESAMVVRYTPSGELDPTFGEGGVVVTDFGLPPRQSSAGSAEPTQVQVAGVAVDPQGRVVLTGTRTRAIGSCRASSNLIYRDAYAARLDTSGAPDPTFGEGGVARLPGIAAVEAPVLDEEGGVYVATPYGGRGPCTEPRDDRLIGHLTAGGGIDPGFGIGGWISLPFRRGTVAVSSAPGPRNTLLLFDDYLVRHTASGPTGRRPSHEIVKVERLLPDGERDRGFGGDGVATLSAPRGVLEVGQGAADASGRVLVAGTYVSDRDHKRRTFFIGRLTANGSRDRHFGRDGLTVTGWGKGAAAVGSSLLVGPHRAMVAGTARSSKFGSGSGLVLTRYRTGR